MTADEIVAAVTAASEVVIFVPGKNSAFPFRVTKKEVIEQARDLAIDGVRIRSRAGELWIG